jgi:hypothetical protein
MTKLDIKNDITLTVVNNANIHGSLLKSKNSTIIMNNISSSLNITETTLYATEKLRITAFYDYDNENKDDVSVHMSLSSVTIGSRETYFKHFKMISLSETQFESGTTITIEKCAYCLLKSMILNLKAPTPLSLTFSDTSIRQGVIHIFNPGRNQKFYFLQSSGVLHIMYLDDKNDTEGNIYLNGADIMLSFDAVSARKVIFNSENSLGSLIYSESDTITFVPDIYGFDRPHYERITEKKKDSDKVSYGNLIAPIV